MLTFEHLGFYRSNILLADLRGVHLEEGEVFERGDVLLQKQAYVYPLAAGLMRFGNLMKRFMYNTTILGVLSHEKMEVYFCYRIIA